MTRGNRRFYIGTSNNEYLLYRRRNSRDMIVQKDDEKEYIAINIGRPNLWNDEDIKRWAKFQSFVKVTSLKIVVNAAYPFVDGLIQENQYYSGDGHSYTFWLESQEDLFSFVKRLEELFGDSAKSVVRVLNPELKIPRDCTKYI